MDINKLKRKKAEALKEAEAINEKLQSNELTEAERHKLEMEADGYVALAGQLNSKIDGGLAAEEASARQAEANGGGVWRSRPGTNADFDGLDAGTIRSVAMTFAEAKAKPASSFGFNGMSDFLTTIKRQREGRAFDQRLSYMAAQSGQDNPSGGFLVPDLLQNNIVQTLDDDEPWLNMVDRYMLPNGYGSASWPVLSDRNESSEDIAGVSTTRRDENSTIATSTMTLEKWKLDPTSHGTLIKVSNELLEDALPGSVDSAINSIFARALRQRMALDLLNGTGAGKPIGIVTSDATYTVAKESMQTAATINGDNILKMRQRLKPSSLNRAVWLANPDSYIQLVNAHTTLTNDDRPLFMHGNGTDVPDTLLGRPIYFTSACQSLGTKGDIILANLSAYQYAMKPVITDTSIHIGFEEHETVYKVVARDDGRPKYTSTHQDVRGFETSEFVVLATRA
jgi:HK97 family phage major capsid protein